MTAFGWIYNISIIYRDYGQFYFLFVFLMQELETLLTSLYKRGRKPKDREIISIKFDQEFTKSEGRTILHCNCKDWSWFYADLRWLVSLESWLWNFVCENKLIKQNLNQRVLNPIHWPEWADCDWSIQSNEEQYRLIESALIPEKELGKFLLDNIKV